MRTRIRTISYPPPQPTPPGVDLRPNAPPHDDDDEHEHGRVHDYIGGDHGTHGHGHAPHPTSDSSTAQPPQPLPTPRRSVSGSYGTPFLPTSIKYKRKEYINNETVSFLLVEY